MASVFRTADIAPQTLSDAELAYCPLCGRFPPPDEYPPGLYLRWMCCGKEWQATGITVVRVVEKKLEANCGN